MDVDRCERCGRDDVDADWLWLEAQRLADDDCEFDVAELAFCSQAHAAAFLQESEIVWQEFPDVDRSTGVRADRFMFGCGLLAIVLSVIGLVALIQRFV